MIHLWSIRDLLVIYACDLFMIHCDPFVIHVHDLFMICRDLCPWSIRDLFMLTLRPFHSLGPILAFPLNSTTHYPLWFLITYSPSYYINYWTAAVLARHACSRWLLWAIPHIVPCKQHHDAGGVWRKVFSQHYQRPNTSNLLPWLASHLLSIYNF